MNKTSSPKSRERSANSNLSGSVARLSLLVCVAALTACATPSSSPPVVVSPPAIPSPPVVPDPQPKDSAWRRHCELLNYVLETLKLQATQSESCLFRGQPIR